MCGAYATFPSFPTSRFHLSSPFGFQVGLHSALRLAVERLLATIPGLHHPQKQQHGYSDHSLHRLHCICCHVAIVEGWIGGIYRDLGRE